MKVDSPRTALTTAQMVQLAAWGLALAASVAAIVAWGQDYRWHFLPFSAYQFFPLLGLVAFGLMWSHYVAGAIRELIGLDKSVLQRYFNVTSLVVLVLICLHPGLLIYQRFQDGYGLPPGSYESYVAPGLGWITLLGTVSLLVFLAFELHRIWGNRPWFNYVRDLSDVAMLAILYHGWRLGTDLQLSWFKYVWLIYTVSLLAVLLRKYYRRWRY